MLYEPGAQVFPAELRYRIGALARARVLEADRLHRPEAQRVHAAPRELLDGQTALEIVRVVELLPMMLLRAGERFMESQVLLSAERAVDVIGAAVERTPIARGFVGNRHVDRLGIDDRADRIEKMQPPLPGEFFDGRGQRVAGQRPRGDDPDDAVVLRQCGHFAPADCDQRFAGDSGIHPHGK